MVVINPETGDLYTDCTMCGVEIEEAAYARTTFRMNARIAPWMIRQWSSRIRHAWNQAMNRSARTS